MNPVDPDPGAVESRWPSPAGIAEGAAELSAELHEAARRVIDSGWFVLGPEVEGFEAEFAAWAGASHCVGVASGTDALALGLRALGIGPGDEVIIPANALPTAFAVTDAGATPVFADVRTGDLNLDPGEVERLTGPATRAVIAVHLYGHPAATGEIAALVDRDRVAIIEDCAQAHGARVGDDPVGLIGDFAAWSFYPTKNLGAVGDAGAVTLGDTALADRIRALRMYGETERYRSKLLGTNSRLDELQAALLRVKLARLDAWSDRRREIAAIYDEVLAGSAAHAPPAAASITHARHLYPVRIEERDAVQAALAADDLKLGIHYPRGAHQQPCFAPFERGSLPVTEQFAASMLSLPIHPWVSDSQARRVAEALADRVG